MKIRHLLYLLLFTSFYSCRDNEVPSPSFDVSVEQQQYKVGDSVRFNFSGESDFITFYSGESGSEYQFKDRLELTGGALQLEFVSRVLYGSEATIRLLASTDFSGKYDTTSVKEATWVDLTDKFAWSTASAGALGPNTPSGKEDITNLLVSGKPIYLAFQYVGLKPPTSTPTQRTWRIVSFSLSNEFADGSVSTVSDLPGAAWVNVDFKNPNNAWAYNFGYLQLAPNHNRENPMATEDWAITKPLNPNKVTPDRGVAIKDFARSLNSYAHAYSAPGVYKVTFVGTNATIDDQKSVVKEVEVTILP